MHGSAFQLAARSREQITLTSASETQNIAFSLWPLSNSAISIHILNPLNALQSTSVLVVSLHAFFR